MKDTLTGEMTLKGHALVLDPHNQLCPLTTYAPDISVHVTQVSIRQVAAHLASF